MRLLFKFCIFRCLCNTNTIVASVVYMCMCTILIPNHHLQYKKMEGRPRSFYHVNGVSVYLGTRGWGQGQGQGQGVLIKRTSALNQEWYVFLFTNIQNSSAWGRNYKIRPQARSFDWEPLPPSVYLGRHLRHQCDKMDHTFPLSFCMLQATINWAVGRAWNEARHNGMFGRKLCCPLLIYTAHTTVMKCVIALTYFV